MTSSRARSVTASGMKSTSRSSSVRACASISDIRTPGLVQERSLNVSGAAVEDSVSSSVVLKFPQVKASGSRFPRVVTMRVSSSSTASCARTTSDSSRRMSFVDDQINSKLSSTIRMRCLVRRFSITVGHSGTFCKRWMLSFIASWPRTLSVLLEPSQDTKNLSFAKCARTCESCSTFNVRLVLPIPPGPIIPSGAVFGTTQSATRRSTSLSRP